MPPWDPESEEDELGCIPTCTRGRTTLGEPISRHLVELLTASPHGPRSIRRRSPWRRPATITDDGNWFASERDQGRDRGRRRVYTRRRDRRP